MESNVLTWGIALEKGYAPNLYPYDAKEVPLGEVAATLDFKIWAKKIMGICCYFTEVRTGKKFQLTVCRRYGDGAYKLEESNIDFKYCDINTVYAITIRLNGKGKTVFKNAVLD